MSESVSTVLLLVAVVSSVLFLEKQAALKKIFDLLPTPFWCYFIPMLLASFGAFPSQSPVYAFFGSYLLGSCLLLLLLNVHLPSIVRLGPTAISATAVGSFGIAAGAVVSYAIFHRWLPPEMWKGVGALAGSWTGGSANMLAVKEALQAPENVFAPMVIVDTIVAYSWMALLVACSVWQKPWDRWVKADRSLLDDVSRRLAFRVSLKNANAPAKLWHGVWLLTGAGVVAWLCFKGASWIPTTSFLNSKGWALLIITALGIVLSMTPVSSLENYGASRWGYVCLYLLLASMGAQAKLQHLFNTPILIVMALVWVCIHASCLIAYGIWKKLPLFFIATASQANIGGVASTPIVAAVYQSQLAPAGLLLAIACNVVGTYIGVGIAWLCCWVAA